jgi:hypothetical protein
MLERRKEPLKQHGLGEGDITRREFLKRGSLFLGALLLGDFKKAVALAEKEANRERGEKEPKISVDIFYAPHVSAKDIEGLEEKLKKTDIYVPEMHLWTEKTLTTLNNVSQQLETPDQALKNLGVSPSNAYNYSFLKKELECIYNSHKPMPILLFDVPDWETKIGDTELDKLAGSYRRQAGSSLMTYRYLPQKDWRSTLDYIKSGLEIAAISQEIRELYILLNLRRLPKIIQNYPSLEYLREKDEVRVLLVLGAAHTHLYSLLKRGKESVAVRREFSKLPILFSYSSEAFRRIIFDKEIDDELAARVLVEKNLPPRWDLLDKGITQDFDKVLKFNRKVIGQLSLDEIKDIFQKANDRFLEEKAKIKTELAKLEKEAAGGVKLEILSKRLQSMEDNASFYRGEYFKALLEGELREKGLKPPRSEIELDEFL